MTFGDRLSTYEPEEKKDLHNVLDIGTGTGIWAIEYGERYPNQLRTFERLLTL
jgi:methylase of polypeptide subunit release factors